MAGHFGRHDRVTRSRQACRQHLCKRYFSPETKLHGLDKLPRPAPRNSPQPLLALRLPNSQRCPYRLHFSAKSQTIARMAFDLKEIVAARLGENYQLHEKHLNRTLVAAQRVIGFDKVYARAEGAYLYDMDNAAYL